MNKHNYRFLWTDREENICFGFVKRLLLIRLNGVDTFLIKNCINVLILVLLLFRVQYFLFY